MKEKIKRSCKFLSVVVIIIIVISVIDLIVKRNNVVLIQLSMHSDRQMMGYIIKTSNNKFIVIDGGTVEDTDNLLKYIKQNNNKVDYWFLTHAHDDHAGAFSKIVNTTDVQIDNIYVSLNEKEWYEKNEPNRAEFSTYLINTLNSDRIKEKVKEPKLNEQIQIDNIKVEILGVKNPEIITNCGNEQSMVIKFEMKNTKLLILGDTGEKSSEKLLNTQKDKLKSDIVQMSHHGQNGATKELYAEINPTVCLWPTPDWLWNNDNGGGYNSGNWKTLETRKWMEDLGVKNNYIEKDGDISIKIN